MTRTMSAPAQLSQSSHLPAGDGKEDTHLGVCSLVSVRCMSVRCMTETSLKAAIHMIYGEDEIPFVRCDYLLLSRPHTMPA